jgi:hypothetical protein
MAKQATATVVRLDKAKLMATVSATVWSDLDSRDAMLGACRAALAGGVDQGAIERRIYLTALAKGLAAKGAAFAEDMLKEAGRVADLAGIDTKKPDDEKVNEVQHQARGNARKALARAIASLGWIGTKSKTGTANKTNAEEIAARREKTATVTNFPVDALALPKFKGSEDAGKFFLGLAAKVEQCQKQNAKHVPAEIAAAGAAYVAAIRGSFKG